MGLYQKLPDDITEVDVIIAGGGTAACIVASRLAQADPALRILVIEGGTNNFNVEKIIYPAYFLENLAPNSNSAIFYQGNKAPQLNGRAPIVPSGGILGGGSSINFMMYTRAQHSDFDSWKTPGWTASDLIPFARKLETYQGYGPEEAHGTSGPIGVTYDTHRSPRIQDDLIAAAGKVGFPEYRDMNDFKSNNGFSCYGRYVGTDGRRSDVAHRYLHPLLQDGKHPNLHVLVEHKVLRVLLDANNRAVGIEFVGNPAFASGTASTTKLRVTATKLVVVSCGALGSPGVLERSGIGSAAVLTKAGVPVLVDLPGVGHDYQDHHLVMLPYQTNLEPHETHDAVMTGKVDRAAAISANDSRLSWNTIDAAGKVRMTDEEVASLGPEFQAIWDRDFKNHPDRPVMLMAVVAMFLGDYTAVPDAQYITLGNYTAYPYSRGHIHITGPGLEDPLDFDTGFFNDEHDIDLKKQLWAYKKLREIARRMNLYRGEVALGHPVFPAGSKAALHDGPLAADSLENIEYSAEDDKAIEHFLRNSVETTWHSLGTVKMAPREAMGAVDKDLNVYGTTALKVVDLSIPPENVAANTNNTALIVGEKGADIIAKELGITLV